MTDRTWSLDADWVDLWSFNLAIARETEWESLLKTLLEAFIRYSQAQQGWLLLSSAENSQNWAIAAQSCGDPVEVTVLPLLPLSDRPAQILHRQSPQEGLAIPLRDRESTQGWICLEHPHLDTKAPLQLLAEVGAIALSKLRPDYRDRTVTSSTWNPVDLVQKLADSSPTLLYLYDLELQQNIYANQALTKILGYTQAEIYDLGELLFLTLMHPDDLARLPSNRQYFKQAEEGEVIEFEYRLRHKNGEWRWLHSWDTIFKRTATGQPQQILGTAIDVTALKQTEHDLYQYKRIIAATSDAIALVDCNYRYQAVNPAYLKLQRTKTLPEILGLPVSHYLGNNTFQNMVKHRLDRCLAGETLTYENWLDFQAAGRLYVSITYSPLWESDGSISGAIASIRDITQLKHHEIALEEAKETAEASHRATSAFLTYMTHELRTPLHAISGFSQLLHRSSNLTEEQKENVAIIQNNNQHLLTLVEQVLEVSKIEAGHKPFNPHIFDLHSLLDDLEISFSRRARRYNSNLLFQRSPNLPPEVSTDEAKFHQILVMLLNSCLQSKSAQDIAIEIDFVREGLATLAASDNPENGILIVTFHILKKEAELTSLPSAHCYAYTKNPTSHLELGLSLTLARKLAVLTGGTLMVCKTENHSQYCCLQLPAIAAFPVENND